MLLRIFCPDHPPPPPLEQSPPRRRQIQWILRRRLPSKTVAQETQRLLGGTSLKLAFRQTGAQRLAGNISTGIFHPVVPLKFQKDIFAHFHNVAHPGRLASRFPATSPPGLAGVWPASGARSTTTHAWPPSPSPSRNGVFLIYMLIWWAHCSTVIILIIFLPLIARPNGWKPSLFQKRLRRHAQKL
jgi:hypothetical protein